MSLQELPIQEQRSIQRRIFSSLLKDARKNDKFSSLMETQASHLRARLISNLLLKAYQGDSIVAWRSSLAPSEIFYALGIVPFFIESVSSLISMAHAYYSPLDTSSSEHYSKDCCTFMRTILGSVSLNLLPTPNFLVGTNFYCDVEPKVADVASSYYKKPHFLLEIPFAHDEQECVHYLAAQIERAMTGMATAMGKQVDLDRLAEVIEQSNQARAYLVEVNRLRRTVPSPIRGREMLDYAAIIANTWGTPEIVEVYRTLSTELNDRVSRGIAAVEGERFRMLWRHLRPYYDDTVLNYLEQEKKAVVAFEEINFVFWDEMDPRKPYESLARKVLSNPSIGRMERWMGATRQMVADHRIDGIITANQWGCRYLDSPSQYTKNVMKEEGTPVLGLDLDLIDKRNYSDGQVRTRIDSFIEILETHKGASC